MKWKDPQFKKPPAAALKKKLSPLQFEVTQNESTEKPFQNDFWDHKEDGIYVDLVSGEPLFCSLDKYDSGCGWPSFTKPIDKSQISERPDNKYSMQRIEVRSAVADSHLGHVFDDGPGPDGARYCINSAALRFIPLSQFEKLGYEEYLKLFEKK